MKYIDESFSCSLIALQPATACCNLLQPRPDCYKFHHSVCSCYKGRMENTGRKLSALGNEVLEPTS